MYIKGKDVKQDYKEAIKWFKKAASQGNADAQYNLDIINNRGVHVMAGNIDLNNSFYINIK